MPELMYPKTAKEWWDLFHENIAEMMLIVKKFVPLKRMDLGLSIEERDGTGIYDILHEAWGAAPDRPAIHFIPGWDALCTLLSEGPSCGIDTGPKLNTKAHHAKGGDDPDALSVTVVTAEGVSSSMEFTLSDQASDNPAEVRGEVKLVHGALHIHVDGYGDFCAKTGEGYPVIVELMDSIVRVAVWDDINGEEPSHLISLEDAFESKREGDGCDPVQTSER